MFRFMIKFLKWLGIACAIGVLIRVGEVLIIKHNENNVEETQQVAEIINDNIVAENINDNKENIENKETIENTDAVIEDKETKQEEKTEIKEKKEAEQVVVPKTSKNTKTEQKQETKVEIANDKQKQKAEEKQEISNTQTLPETTKQEVLEKEEETQIQEETQTDEKYTEIEVDVAEKKECNGNNHGIGVGNSGKWFNTKDEAIATYKAEIKIWGDKWTDTNNPISDDEYYKNCPTRL